MSKFVRCLAATAMALVASPTVGAAKPNQYPCLAAEAKDLAGFVPKGWKLLQSAADGDLNKDGSDDLVGVIEKTTKTEPDPGQDGPPRILFIAFQKPGLVSRQRGQPSNRKLAVETKAKVVALVREQYSWQQDKPASNR